MRKNWRESLGTLFRHYPWTEADLLFTLYVERNGRIPPHARRAQVMAKFRFSLVALLGFVALVAVALATLRNASAEWSASAVFTTALAAMLITTLVAILMLRQ